ncbi:hypothetical protein VTL71DRAFT_10760 [Oculimacula yallundae]|uniref:VOC domain-containing protein n=1 Tax=Oculimacula yallundae TaxID=86028 RepID=A0ABR4CU04_9HELO
MDILLIKTDPSSCHLDIRFRLENPSHIIFSSAANSNMINHFFLMVSASKMPALRNFYRTILQPLGYTEMIVVKDGNICGFGSDYPYFWLKALPEGKEPVPTHIAIEAKGIQLFGEEQNTETDTRPDPAAVDKFYEIAIKAGGIDNGKPGIRPGMSRQPYYAAFVIDADGNNFEAVSVVK